MAYKRGFVGLKVVYTKPIFFKVKDEFHEEYLVSEKKFKQLARLAKHKQRVSAGKLLQLGKGARVKQVTRTPQSRLMTGFLSDLHLIR